MLRSRYYLQENKYGYTVIQTEVKYRQDLKTYVLTVQPLKVELTKDYQEIISRLASSYSVSVGLLKVNRKSDRAQLEAEKIARDIEQQYVDDVLKNNGLSLYHAAATA